jgi:23S rRNA pseudouridine1911/1915/1917 synthase
MIEATRESRVIADSGDAGTRLDQFVAAHVPGVSRSQAQRLIKSGLVTVDGHPEKGSLPMAAGMSVVVSVPPASPATPVSEALPLQILFDDEDVVVVDKPAGMVVHPAAGHASGTLVNALLHHVRGLSGIGGQERPGIVHRLDKGTSGVMVIAKHDRAHQSLARQFHDRKVEKDYTALVWGRPLQGQVFDRPIGRDPRDRKRMSSRGARTRTARTSVESVETIDGVSLVRLRIHTGRTHQIRVHLSEAGFPLVGDDLYGGVRAKLPARLAAIRALGRPFLHATTLTFAHPADNRSVTVSAPLPADLTAVLDALRRAAATPHHTREKE